MDLSTEDTLRLKVLLANKPLAIRIHESSMTLYALGKQGEARVALNPTGRDEPYLRAVREMLSGHVLGSPGGYPVFLKRWTRMGQTRDDNLEQLLLLGEPEAVVAVVNSPGLTDELARRAWWIEPSSEMARQMLRWEVVRVGAMGRVLAEHLLEHLDFEEDPQAMANTVRLILSDRALLDDRARLKIWKKGQRKNACLLGFLASNCRDFPVMQPERADRDRWRGDLEALMAEGNIFAERLSWAFSAAGQTYLEIAESILKKPFNQDVVNDWMDTVAARFGGLLPNCDPDRTLEQVRVDAVNLCQGLDGESACCPSGLLTILERMPALRKDLHALLVLGRLGYPVVRPVFSRSTAIGTLMRKKLVPVTDPIFALLNILRTPLDPENITKLD